MKTKVALTIGGHDPSGGAGIGADLVTFAVLGVHGAAVATALTYQNTRGVTGFWTVGVRELKAQLDAVLEDIAVGAVKVGMLASEGVAHTVAPYLARFKEARIPVVFDPVYRAGAGQPLFEGVADKIFADMVLPYASVITPNTLELAALIGEEPAQNIGDLRTQVRVYHGRYNGPVLATGGHIPYPGDIVDVLFTGGDMREYRRRRAPGDVHGTGCLLAAAITAYFAAGVDLLTAAERAEDYVTAALGGAYAIGRDALVPERTAAVFYDAERWRVFTNLQRAVKVFESGVNTYKLLPEVGTNIAYALPDARAVADVCAVPGRIVRVVDAVRAFGPPAFGGSGHMARAVIAVMRHDPDVRAVMNVRYGDDIIAACRALGYRVASFDRGEEPPAGGEEEGQTVSWGVERAITAAGAVPEVIFDRGAPGKEPMVRILGTDAVEVVRRAIAISRRLT